MKSLEELKYGINDQTCPVKVATVDFPFVPVTANNLILLGRISAAKSNSDTTFLPFH